MKKNQFEENHIKHHNTENLVLLGMLGTTILSGALLTLPSVLADDSTVTDVNITVPVACAVTSTVGTAHTASVDSGTYEDDIGTTTIKTTCNDSQGFSIYAIGYTNEEYGNTTLKPSTLDATQNSIITGTATSGATSNWAMKLTAVSSTYTPTILSDTDGAYSSYHKVPTTYTKVATMTSNTNATTGASIEATYAVYIAGDQPADTYNGKVKYTMVHPASAPEPFLPHEETTASGQICYYPNFDATAENGTMGCQTIPTSGGSADTVSPTAATLLASNFSRDGYGFAGWTNKYDYATNPTQEGIKFYGPQETITFTAGQYSGSNDGLSLYAVWVKSAGDLQDTTKVAELCGTGTNALTTAPTDGTANLKSVSALTDQRDSQTYAIAKLADGKCWMIENLRLESTASHNTDGALAQGYGTSTTYGNFSGLADAESTGFTSTYSANSLYSNDGSNNTINIGTSTDPALRMPRYNNWNNQSTSANRPQNPTTNDATNSTTNAGMYSYGNYYTWHAAIADLTYNETNNQSTANTSLCPTGWHLPTGGLAYASGSTSGVNVTGDTNTFREFYNLGYKTMDKVKTAYEDTPSNGYAYYSSNTTNTAGKTATAAIRSFPNNFLYSGRFLSSSALSRGSNGLYWSSTAVGSNFSYLLYLDSSGVLPGTYNYLKSYGLSIRCVSGS